MKKILTLCVICKDGKVLLGMKKRGFGEGRWNGFGGKVEDGETIEMAAARELKEEAGVEATGMREMGVLDFSFESDPKILEVHIFKIDEILGDPLESEEMRPQWFSEADIPFEQMWPDDVFWFPYLLSDKIFRGSFHFDRPSDATYTAKILKEELREVDSL